MAKSDVAMAKSTAGGSGAGKGSRRGNAWLFTAKHKQMLEPGIGPEWIPFGQVHLRAVTATHTFCGLDAGSWPTFEAATPFGWSGVTLCEQCQSGRSQAGQRI
jgi:hypothetical protein